MNIKISDEAVQRGGWIIAEHRSQAWLTYSDETRAAIARSWEPTARAVLEAAAPLPPRFTYTEEDLQSLARGVVPEWLRFDADAALDEELAK